jgi:hypothetical protein
MQWIKIRIYANCVRWNLLYVAANIVIPIKAGSTSRSQVKWSFGFMPDQIRTEKNITNHRYFISFFPASLFAAF